jgi:hypothetical protein
MRTLVTMSRIAAFLATTAGGAVVAGASPAVVDATPAPVPPSPAWMLFWTATSLQGPITSTRTVRVLADGSVHWTQDDIDRSFHGGTPPRRCLGDARLTGDALNAIADARTIIASGRAPNDAQETAVGSLTLAVVPSQPAATAGDTVKTITTRFDPRSTAPDVVPLARAYAVLSSYRCAPPAAVSSSAQR